MNLKTVTALLFSFAVTWASAQTDTTTIKSYADQVMVRVNFDTNIEKYIFTEGPEENAKETSLSINNKTRASLSLDYRIISATLSFAPNFLPGNSDDDVKGRSSYTDIRFRFFPKKFIQTVYYKNVKGFYIDNMKDLYPGWQEGRDPYLKFPDLRVQSFGGSTAYVLKNDFSLKSTYTQGEWQSVSRGSWVPIVDYDLSIFRDVIDGQKSKEYQYNIGASMGYFYNWIISKKINVSPHVSFGIGGMFSNSRSYERDGSVTKENTQYMTVRFSSGLHIGYNTDRFLFGGKFNINAQAYEEKENQTVQSNSMFGLLYIGYRFAPPRAVKNTYDAVQKKIPVL